MRKNITMRAVRGAVVILILSGGAIAQPKDARSEFEVASIKPAPPDARGTFIRTVPGGRVTINNMTLKDLIMFAWRVQPFQVSGGPAWLDSVRFDISAKPDHNPEPNEMQLMMQALLKDRFQLTIHPETKELPIYALVLAKQEKLGPKLTEVKEGSCPERDPNKPPPPEPGEMPCGSMRMSPGAITAGDAPPAPLAPGPSPPRGPRGRGKTRPTPNIQNTPAGSSPDGPRKGVSPPPPPPPP